MGLIEAAARLSPAADHLRILTFDVERQRGQWLVEQWDPYLPKFARMETMLARPRIMCWAAKWYGEPEVLYADERGRNGRGTGGARRMIRDLWDLLEQADVVVTFNGDKADIPWANEEFNHFGLPRPMPFKSIDLYKQEKRPFARPYHSLRYTAKIAGVGDKLEHNGRDLWRECAAGDPEAWDLMREYNMQDVRVTEGLWLERLGWLDGSTHLGVLISDGNAMRCPNCGSARLSRKGKVTANVRQYEGYRCDDCHAPLRTNLLTGQRQLTRAAR